MKLNCQAFSYLIIFLLVSCNPDSQWKGQAPVKAVNTSTVPIQMQQKGIYDLGNGINVSNDFLGARMNGVAMSGDTLVNILITAENEPINMSPWYAFKIWAESQKQIKLKLNYQEPAYHRYYPKLSKNYQDWYLIDSADYSLNYTMIQANEEYDNSTEVPESAVLVLEIDTDTLWVAAQPNLNSNHNAQWVAELDSLPFVRRLEIGKSRRGTVIPALIIGDEKNPKMNVIFSRQHPPEVTGYRAMQTFVEALCDHSDLANSYREGYTTLVIPMINPDGVDLGHWRHNAGGVDLNRDWKAFNQPETSAVRDFLESMSKTNQGTYYFAVDFHSTWEDIFYLASNGSSNLPGLSEQWINQLGNRMEGYEPNIRRMAGADPVTSDRFMFATYHCEALTYEVGDNTPEDFIQKKSQIAAKEWMKLLSAN